jgi:hypothetical protein
LLRHALFYCTHWNSFGPKFRFRSLRTRITPYFSLPHKHLMMIWRTDVI